jgi:hypothetical protein
MSQEDNTQDDGKKFTERVKEKAARVRQHVKDNRNVYLAAGGGVLVGGTVVGVVALRHMGFQVPEIQQTAKNTALVIWKPVNTNIVLVKQACPDPIPVLDKTTGESYRSLRRAVEATGKTLAEISKDAQGPQVRFERLPDSVFA